MPRNVKGIGRTGKKHTKKAAHDINRQHKSSEGISGPLFIPEPQEVTEEADEQVPLVASSDEQPASLREALTPARPVQPHEYVPHPHPRYADEKWDPLPGFRGSSGAYGSEAWDPDVPPCIPSDERPPRIFGSQEAAEAAAAADRLERTLPYVNCYGDPDDSDFEDYYDEEGEEVARVKYRYALRRLGEAYPELKIPAGLHAGLAASEQETRPCPCGAGLLAKWPWVLHDRVSLGFCPSADWSRDPSADDSAVGDIQDRHSWEMTCWRSEWISAAPGGDNIAW